MFRPEINHLFFGATSYILLLDKRFMRFYLFNQHLLSCDYSFMWFTLSSSLINLNYIWKYNKLNMDFFISGTFHYYLCLLKVMSNNRGKNLCTNNWFSINVDVFWYVSVYECLIWWLEKKNRSIKKNDWYRGNGICSNEHKTVFAMNLCSP